MTSLRSASRKPLHDLRPDATPWRSDVMLDAIAAAIERYEQIVASGGWPSVPQGRMMRAGDDDPRVPILRKRLRASGDLPAKGQYYNNETFDGELEVAVRRFQLRNGIRPTGRIEQSVYATLNITRTGTPGRAEAQLRARCAGSCPAASRIAISSSTCRHSSSKPSNVTRCNCAIG